MLCKTSFSIGFGLLACAAFCSVLNTNLAFSQDIQIVAEVRESGKIRNVKSGLISIINAAGKVVTCKIQDKGDRAIMLDGTPYRMPAAIDVKGDLPIRLIERGMVVQFQGRCDYYGRCDGEISQVVIINQIDPKLKVDFLERPEPGEAGQVAVVGRVVNLTKNKLQLEVPKSKWAKRQRITFEMTDDATMQLTSDDLKRVQPGDEVTSLVIHELSNKDLVAKSIDIKLTAERDEVTTSFHEKLEQEFSKFSDEPGEPRELRSDNYVMYTDVSDRQAKILFAKLENMHALVGGYFGKRPRIPIECYVVGDLAKWSGENLDPRGVAKIREPAGLTIYAQHIQSKQTKAVVYSCDQHGVVQHEAVHAFCAQTFGSTGPVWYSEGMAEMGQYWKPGQLAVNIDPVVIDYLTSAKPKKMADIVAAGQITGDSWQAYAWRWALCHLLASNPNYRRRFKKLGLNMMMGDNDSFERAFGKVAENIAFEYDQFVQNFGNGYRVDLCAWDWSVKASNLPSTGRTKSIIKAEEGWQPTKLEVRTGVSYDFVVSGEWKLSSTEKMVSANGYPAGEIPESEDASESKSNRGALVGVVLHDFKLHGPFDLGEKGSFELPVTGQLYLRCNDSWTELADNEGELLVHLRRTPK